MPVVRGGKMSHQGRCLVWKLLRELTSQLGTLCPSETYLLN